MLEPHCLNFRVFTLMRVQKLRNFSVHAVFVAPSFFVALLQVQTSRFSSLASLCSCAG